MAAYIHIMKIRIYRSHGTSCYGVAAVGKRRLRAQRHDKSPFYVIYS